MAWFWLGFVLALAAQEDSVLERARLLVQKGRAAEAIRMLETRSRSAPSAPELVYLAELLAANGGLPQAAVALERALALAPEQHGLRITRGAILFELRRYGEARRELEEVVSRRPDAGLAHYYLGAVYKGLGELALARAAAGRAVDLLPPDGPAPLEAAEHAPSAAARQLLAEIRFERGEDAVPLLREVLALEPSHAGARYLLGRALLQRGQAEKGRQELERFERIKKADAHLGRGRELSRAGRLEEALAELRLAVESDPEHARALFALGRALARSGRREEAASCFERLLAIHPESAPEIESWLAAVR